MTFSTYLDVAISLVFVFFTISMFVSGIVELINTFWEQRSKLLQLALQKKVAYLSYLQTNIDALHLPIGWELTTNITVYQWITRVLGWLLTIAALSFGAPFWFDLLVKLVNIRNTARRPQSSVVPDSR